MKYSRSVSNFSSQIAISLFKEKYKLIEFDQTLKNRCFKLQKAHYHLYANPQMSMHHWQENCLFFSF